MDEHGRSSWGPPRGWLIGLLSIGLILRLVAAWASPGIMHPDEHQQYIEQSFRLVHGFGATCWEQDTGLRHPLFSMILAGILWTGERAGITDPHRLAALQRIILAISSYAALAALAWSVHARGQRVAGMVIAILLACSVDLVFIQVRVMSENATLAVMALVLVCWPRRALLAGLLLGAMIALRLQTAPLAIGLWAVAGWEAIRGVSDDSRRRWLALSIGLAVSVMLMGATDAIYYGNWFHSSLTNIRLQALSNSNNTGVSPIYAYLLTGGAALLRISIVAAPLIILGAWRRPDLAAVAIVFLVAHSLVPHKEVRYMWPMAPIVCLLFAAGIEAWHARRPLGRSACGLLIASVLLPSLVRTGFIQWRVEAYMASCDGLARIGQAHDVYGVVMIDLPSFEAGNYFYLRVPAPIHHIQNAEQKSLSADPDWTEGRLNYVFARRDSLSPSIKDHLRCIGEYGKWAVYSRVAGGQQARVAAKTSDWPK